MSKPKQVKAGREGEQQTNKQTDNRQQTRKDSKLTMNTIREIERINEEELSRGIAGTAGSWHSKYLKSAWCYVGNLSHDLSEGDIICVLSQWGEIDDMHLVRDESTGKSRGFAFVKYEDSRSCVLAVDNMVGSTILGRSIRIDHVENYRLPKNVLEKEEEKRNQERQHDDDGNVGGAGHAYEDKEMVNKYRINHGVDLFDPSRRADDDDDDNGSGSAGDSDDDDNNDSERRREQKRQRKEERKRKREEKEERHRRKEERRKHKRHKDDDKKKKKKRKHSPK